MIKRKVALSRVSVTIAVLVLTVPPLSRAQGEFESFKVDAALLPGLKEVARAVHMDQWPRSDALRVAPQIAKDLLLAPSRVTDERVAYSTDLFQDNTAVRARWVWNCFQDNPEGVPSTLPQEYRDSLFRRLPEDRRNDPNYVQERLSRALERYQRSKRYKLVGSLEVNVCCALDAVTAQEFLIGFVSISCLPTEGVVSHFSKASRMEGLGDVAFKHTSLMFARGNIAVAITGNRQLEEESLPLARKIDSMIQKQTALTRSEFESLRPVVSIAASARKTARGLYVVEYNVTTPGDQKVAVLRTELTHGDERSSARAIDGRIEFSAAGSTARIRVEVITEDLLTTVIERSVALLDELVQEEPEKPVASPQR